MSNDTEKKTGEKRVVDLKKMKKDLQAAYAETSQRSRGSGNDALQELIVLIDQVCADETVCGPDMAIPLS